MKVGKIYIWICTQLKYYQLKIRSEIGILLEIILNAFKYLTVSLSTKILILDIVPLSFISVSILYKFSMLPDVYILLCPQEEEVHVLFFLRGQVYTSGSTFIKNIEHFTCHHIRMSW